MQNRRNSKPRVPMPSKLVLLMWLLWAWASLSMTAGAMAKHWPMRPEWYATFVLSCPFSFALAVGFLDRQGWTRWLFLVFSVLVLARLAVIGEWAGLAVVAFLLSIPLSYLFLSREARIFYERLREERVVSLSTDDARLLWDPTILGGFGGLAVAVAAVALISTFLPVSLSRDSDFWMLQLAATGVLGAFFWRAGYRLGEVWIDRNRTDAA